MSLGGAEFHRLMTAEQSRVGLLQGVSDDAEDEEDCVS